MEGVLGTYDVPGFELQTMPHIEIQSLSSGRQVNASSFRKGSVLFSCRSTCRVNREWFSAMRRLGDWRDSPL